MRNNRLPIRATYQQFYNGLRPPPSRSDAAVLVTGVFIQAMGFIFAFLAGNVVSIYLERLTTGNRTATGEATRYARLSFFRYQGVDELIGAFLNDLRLDTWAVVVCLIYGVGIFVAVFTELRLWKCVLVIGLPLSAAWALMVFLNCVALLTSIATGSIGWPPEGWKANLLLALFVTSAFTAMNATIVVVARITAVFGRYGLASDRA